MWKWEGKNACLRTDEIWTYVVWRLLFKPVWKCSHGSLPTREAHGMGCSLSLPERKSSSSNQLYALDKLLNPSVSHTSSIKWWKKERVLGLLWELSELIIMECLFTKSSWHIISKVFWGKESHNVLSNS